MNRSEFLDLAILALRPANCGTVSVEKAVELLELRDAAQAVVCPDEAVDLDLWPSDERETTLDLDDFSRENLERIRDADGATIRTFFERHPLQPLPGVASAEEPDPGDSQELGGAPSAPFVPEPGSEI